MIKLTQTHYFLSSAIHSGDADISAVKKIAKEEIQKIEPALLPLQQGLSLSSAVSNSPFSVIVLNVSEDVNLYHIKAGIFYTGIIAGCSCSDDPSPTDEQNEYCELRFTINKETAETTVTLIKE